MDSIEDLIRESVVRRHPEIDDVVTFLDDNILYIHVLFSNSNNKLNISVTNLKEVEEVIHSLLRSQYDLLASLFVRERDVVYLYLDKSGRDTKSIVKNG